MIKLNLTANNEAEKRIKEYLENNVSETLADKINNGVTITKDNKELINKKDLSGFMNYANEEARKLAEKGARYACVEDATVFGWAIHYFEEDSINGKLFNQDGSEYKAPAPKITKKETPKPQVKVVEKEENKQATLFDFFDNPTETKQEETKMVFIAPDGERYHYKSTCAGKNAIEATFESVSRVYEPCKKCAKD